MRTLTQRLVGDPPSLRLYTVSMTITFVCQGASDRPILALLQDHIRHVDEQFPWKDVRPRGEQAQSIGVLSGGEVVVDQWHTPEKRIVFSIHPGRVQMERGQLHAYEKYAEKIASKLAAMKLPGIKEVGFTVHTTMGALFA